MIDKIGGVSSLVGTTPRISAAPTIGQGDFATTLAQLTTDAVQNLKSAEQASVAGIKGEMPVQEVVSTVMQAERSLQTAIAVRDKVVSAYLEINRMQI